MKLARQRVAAFLASPGRIRVVLLYGADAGLIAERSELLTRAVAGDEADPFRLVTVSRAEELPEASVALALGGGRRVVRLADAGEGAAGAVAAVLRGPGDALVLLEAPGLSPGRSKLLKLIDAHAEAAAIACYPEAGGELARSVRGWLAASGVTADDGVVAWLVSRLGADRALSRAEIEKLALYAGRGGAVDLVAAEAVVGDVAGLSLDDALFAATEGEVALADRALERALAAGAAPVTVIRGGLAHLSRLQRKELRPPLSFQRRDSYARALKLWSAPALALALDTFFAGERQAKRTGVPDGVLCRHLVLSLAMTAAAARAH